jgi:alkylated DNA repair dioxygenase AlkB
MEKIELVKSFIDKHTCAFLFEELTGNEWNNDDLGTIWHEKLLATDGSFVKIKRKMGYMSEKPTLYKYANLSFGGNRFTPGMEEFIKSLNLATGRNFNSVLLNWYKNGKDEIKWHSDKEAQLGENPTIYALNLGATRKFWFLNKATGEKSFYLVSNGDLLKMNEGCQADYLHAILPEKGITEPRISLTFREVI